jgi:hypothetical protein
MELRYLLGAGMLAIGVASCSPETPKAYLTPDVPEEKVIQDNTQVFDPKVDILFVVDNSGSMASHQRNVSANVTKFTSTFTKSSVLDYNIGIVTTDMVGRNWGARKDCCGQLVGVNRVVNKNTPNADSVLASNFLVGTDGSSTEASFDPVVMALSQPNLTGWNYGFYRPDASLVVIFMTDAEDQSDNTTPQGLYSFLLNLKQGDASKILAFGVIVPTDDTMNCPRDEPRVTPKKIESFLSMVQNKNNIMNICDPDYGTRLANMAKDIVDKVGNLIYLNRAPALDTIHVYYGSAELPQDYETGWSFDPKKNAIILGSKIKWNSQPSGSRVKVSYTAAKFD